MITEVNGIPVEITRKRVKNINLRISPDGKVRVSAPYLCTDRQILRFVASRTDWIEQKLHAVASRAEQFNEEIGKEEIAELKRRIAVSMAFWEEKTGLHPAGWRIRKMKTCWGTCNTKSQMITINTRLIKYPPECLDYVVLHELAHLKVPNHGPEFKAVLNRYMPDWKQKKEALR